MQIIIELTDEEAAAIEAEIDTFPVYEEAVRMTIADYLKDYSQPNITRLVEAARVKAKPPIRGTVATTSSFRSPKTNTLICCSKIWSCPIYSKPSSIN